jgi:hypothetical protein
VRSEDDVLSLERKGLVLWFLEFECACRAQPGIRAQLADFGQYWLLQVRNLVEFDQGSPFRRRYTRNSASGASRSPEPGDLSTG